MGAPDVLLVDDNDMAADAIRECLRLCGYRVALAKNAEEGWEVFQRRHPRALITDNALLSGDPFSDTSGLELAAKVRGASPMTPIIMLSALPPVNAREVCDAVLVKPVPARVLVDALALAGVRGRAQRTPPCEGTGCPPTGGS
ncbi:MAG: response regulator [Armatimonadetes bacterium]|nr:response regulator [Armatimonadota bacterium]